MSPFPLDRRPAAGAHRRLPRRTPLAALAALLALAVPPSATAQARPSGDGIADVFAAVGDAVVTVKTIGRQVSARNEDGFTTLVGTGSGVLVGTQGDVYTAAHVVQTSDAVVVEFPDGVQVGAKVVGSDLGADVARLRLDTLPPGRRSVELGDSDAVRTGDEVLVVGAPLGISHSLTVGHISSRRLKPALTGGLRQVEFFQTDAAVNHGNSGGPMFDLSGRVIGIVSHIVTTSGGSQGLGFAVTSNTVRELLIEQSATWTGIDWIFVEGDFARALNLPPGTSGLLVQNVAHDSPGEKLGLKGGTLPATVGGEDLALGGDVIVSILGLQVSRRSFDAIRAAVLALPAGEKLTLTVLRAGERVTLTAP